MTEKISVVIPVKNVENEITQCLAAIFDQTIKPLEVLVIDGHSIDKTLENAKKFPVKIIFEEYGSPAGARQVGLINSIGDYIAFTDSDCIPYSNWLENLIKEFQEDDVFGVGGGTIYYEEGLWKKSIYLSLNTFLGSATSVQDRVFNEKRIVKSISGCNSIYKKQKLLELGGFNIELEGKIGRISEDAELNKRLCKFGKLIYTPDALVVHNHDKNFKDFVRRMFFWGYVRANNKLFNIQTIPPIIALIVFLSALVSIQFFSAMIFLYISLISFFSLRILIQQKDFRLLFTVPIIFLSEHIAYTLGFWRGVLNIIFIRRLKS